MQRRYDPRTKGPSQTFYIPSKETIRDKNNRKREEGRGNDKQRLQIEVDGGGSVG